MSRLGKKPIAIPKGTTISVVDGTVTVKGPKGEISRLLKPVAEGVILITVTPEEVVASIGEEDDNADALWGTIASHVTNMIAGTNKEFEEKLIIEGVGYKAAVSGTNLVLNIGYSHDVPMPIPEGLKATSEKGEITISGIDKDAVGQFAAKVRAQKKPEPYKGKGIRYADEVIRRKQGKKAV